MNGFVKSDFFVNLKYRNGNFSASLLRNKSWGQCNNSEMLHLFEDIYQFMKSTQESTSIAGMPVSKMKTKLGKDRFSIDFGLYSINVTTPKNNSSDSVLVYITMPFAMDNNAVSNDEEYYAEEEYA